MEAINYDERYNRDDYYRWEGDWELIEGHPYAMSPAPGVTHQRLSLKIAMELEKGVEGKGGCRECLVLQDVDYEISEDTIVRPDVLLICKEIKESVDKAPEVIFEIISASTARRDESVKMELYRREGVRYYGLVYPNRSVVKLYRLNSNGEYMKVDDFTNEKCRLELSVCSLEIDFSKIWR